MRVKSLKFQIQGNGTLLEQNDYYPFGLRTTRGENYATLSQSLAAIAQSAGNTSADTSAPEYLYNGKEKQEFIKNTSAAINAGGSADYTSNYLDYGARFYNPTTLRWNTQDPLAEKYYRYSPYVYCVNEPISLVDPNGEDNYRFDEKTGTFHLMKETDDDFDQILDYKQVNGEYVAKTGRKGKAKVKISDVEKGILKDGIDFKNTDNTIEIGEGDNSPTQQGIEKFLLDLSNLIYREVGGVYSTSDNKSLFVTITGYKNNTDEHALIHILSYFNNNDGKRVALYPQEVFHTHLSSKENKNVISGDDREGQRVLTSQNKFSHLRFSIITSPPFTRISY